ncbi:MAG: hypothetical protein Q8O91_03235 [Candidatus Aminicenantes bacterium]|nr:hypothetical protein [Candidatus Aminicenantes bacterium]
MRAKTILILILAAAAFTAAAAEEKKPVESLWTPAPLQIDGKLTEWAPESLSPFSKLEVRYGFRNDANFLYCAFLFDNPRYLSSIEASGLTFWIHPEKEKQTHGFRFYRKMVTPDQLIEEMEKSGTPLTDEKKAELKAKKSYMLYVCDVVDKKGNIIPRQPGVGNGTYRVARVEKTIVFEYAIPLALLIDPNQKPALDPTKPFKLGFKWGGTTEEMKKQALAQIGDDNVRVDSRVVAMAVSEGGGERSEGAEPGGRSASLEGVRSRLPKEYDFWIDLKLGEKK